MTSLFVQNLFSFPFFSKANHFDDRRLKFFSTTFRPLRTSVGSLIQNHLVDYPTPLTLTYFWGFGSVAGLMLTVQIVTGLFLTFHYAASTQLAFDAMEHIMRDVNYGWLLRFTHCNGASFFFLIVYAHIGRAFYYGSFLFPRYHLWASGVVIFLLMMATAFMGYVLPWGQMSFWGATVITNLFSAVPLIGDDIATWLWGGFSVDNPTLNRFFGFHFIVPFVIAGAVGLHLLLLHSSGSSDPVIGTYYQDRLPFYPYFYTKDLVGLLITFIFLSFFVFFTPDSLGHPDNYIEGNALVTPAHIVPEWYFLPFYAMLRAVPDKLGGVICMIAAILILLAMPISFQAAPSFHPAYDTFWSILVGFFFSAFLTLGWLGAQSVELTYVILGQLLTLFYFSVLLMGFTFLSFLSWRCLCDVSSKLPGASLFSLKKPISHSTSMLGSLIIFTPFSLHIDVLFLFETIDFLIFIFGLYLFFFYCLRSIRLWLRLSPVELSPSSSTPLNFFFTKFVFSISTFFWNRINLLRVVSAGRRPFFFILIFLSLFLWVVLWEVKNLVLYFVVLELLGVIPIIFIVLGQRRPSLFSYETAIKYLLFNVLTAFFFLISVIILYSVTRSLDLSYISRCITLADTTNNVEALRIFSAALILFLTPFFFKLGLAPFHWLIHDIYRVMPFSFFSVYASFYKFFASVTVFQIIYFIFYPVVPYVLNYFLFSAIATTIICLLAVVSSFSIRPIFGYLSASSAALLILSFLLCTDSDLGFFLTGIVFFLSGMFVYSTALFIFFFSLNVISRSLAIKVYYVSELTKVLWLPGLRLFFFIIFFILSGLPPTSVFWFKFSILELLSLDYYYSWLSFFFLTSQLIFLFTYFKLVKSALFDKSFFSLTTSARQRFSVSFNKSLRNYSFTRFFNSLVVKIAILSTLSLFFSLFFFDFCLHSAAQFIEFLAVLWNN